MFTTMYPAVILPEVLDPKHNTKPETIQATLKALGKRIVVSF